MKSSDIMNAFAAEISKIAEVPNPTQSLDSAQVVDSSDSS